MIRETIKLLLTVLPAMAFGQYNFEMKQVITDTKDSIFLNASELNIDSSGNYLAVSDAKEAYYIYTPTKKIGPLHFKSGSDISTYKDVKNPDLYYYTTRGAVNIVGPIEGKDISDYRHPISNYGNHSAIPILEHDSINIYVDGRLLNTIDLTSTDNITVNGKQMEEAEAKKQSFENDNWLGFSDNGKSIYSLEQGRKKRLYKNGFLLDTTADDYHTPLINNDGFYVYVARHNGPADGGRGTWYAKTSDSIFGPTQNAWTYALRNDGAYYLSNSDGSILVNNHLYNDVSDVSQLKVLDKKHFMFLSKDQNDSLQINVSDKIYSCNFSNVQLANADTNGNYAFYTVQNYYLYKIINGIKIEDPLTKYNERAQPLYISPAGKSLHYFRTDDSTYIWSDDTLVFCFSNETTFNIQKFDDLYVRNGRNFTKEAISHSLFYMHIDTLSYLVYDGVISPHMPFAHEEHFDGQKTGDIINATLIENGFYVIQKTGEKEYTVNINNQILRKVEDVDKVLNGNCFFDGKELIFYGINGYAIQQYKIKL